MSVQYYVFQVHSFQIGGGMVSKGSPSVIKELQRDSRFMGTCPCCGGEFSLADAALFSIGDKLAPDVAIAAIKAARERITDRRRELVEQFDLMNKGAERTAKAVNLGKIVEKIVPSFASFAHPPGDCRALFEPIDYLIFCGLSGLNRVDSLLFVDVKSGKARLNSDQRSIRKVVEAGEVEFETLK